MGTRGLVFIRCHGRYFAFREAIVHQIPENDGKYHEWLESMRKVFTRFVQKLEEQYIPLVIPDSRKQDGLTSSLAERYMKSFLSVDDRLEMPPIQTLLPHLWGSDIEWMYTIDLDRELLGVDHSVYLKLSKIPREGRWHQYLDVDENRRRRVFQEETPGSIVGDVALKPSINSDLRARYNCIGIEPMSLKGFHSSTDTLLPREALLLSIFSCIHRSFKKLLDPFILEWTPESFSFQEIAFALLSIAAGEVTFESIRALDKNYEAEGYYILPDGHLLPCFLYERHFPGVEPGSAPRNRTYWFSNVLVHLVSRLDLVDVEKAAVIEVVDAGLDQGLDEFYAMVFSISDVILVHVQKGGGRVRVQRSDLMPLFYFDEESSNYLNGPRTRPAQDTQPPTPGGCRQLSDRKFRLNDGYDVVGIDAQSMGSSRRFVIEDIQTGKRFYSEVQHLDLFFSRNTEKDMLDLYIVIGEETTRRSVISLAALQFPMLPPKDTPFTNEVQMPISERYHYHFGRTLDSSKLFKIPNYQYIGFVEDAWGKYIHSMIQRETRHFEVAQFVQISGAQYRCLLPPGYRKLGMYHCFCNGLQAFLRHPQDESHEEWMKTIKYAVHQLSHLEQCPDSVFIVRGRSAIVAFGTRVKLFYYIYHREEAPVVPQNASPTSIQFAVSCTDPEPKHRLVQLIPGSEPIDLYYKDDRAKLEHWLKVFCDKKDFETEWDPITGEYITMARGVGNTE
ncbi:hypothetical protein BDV33DRAFT_192439 [Aspergillus novoparasiticus]|uniref:F-box domain protein n=1 Tax=Aspergillus novoparasiticus TaxID=986946 RepID=A0A5N6EQV0_9EURO|nr:hypothetical protein BDV33DRAFT_192439 [Aspergillus novoparasiticus]